MPFKEKIFHKEENCLNCNYPLVGKFCGNCGQKAFLHKDSFWHMTAHFAGDYFHYDNKFWTTIQTLFTKPGLITLEYISGKRAKYLNPIQLYIFVTTVFFIFFFTNSNSKKIISITGKETTTDSLTVTTPVSKPEFENISQIKIGDYTPNEKTLHEYDSVQNSLPSSKRNGYFRDLIKRKMYKYADMNTKEWSNIMSQKVKHNFPKVFFILLPFFALLLRLVFRKKKMYYVDHLIFSIHFHSFLFILTGIQILLTSMITNSTFNTLFTFINFIGIGIYLLLSFRRVYNTSWMKLIIKQAFLFFAYLIGFFITLLFVTVFTFLFA